MLPFSVAALLVFACAPAPATAQAKYDPGATDTEIKIGNIMPYSGAFSEYGATGRAEAAYFQMIDEHGGVNGRKIKFISLDSGSDTGKSVALAHQLRRLQAAAPPARSQKPISSTPERSVPIPRCADALDHRYCSGVATRAARQGFQFRTPIVASNLDLGGDADPAPFLGPGKTIQRTRVATLANGWRVGFLGLMGRDAASVAPAAGLTKATSWVPPA